MNEPKYVYTVLVSFYQISSLLKPCNYEGNFSKLKWILMLSQDAGRQSVILLLYCTPVLAVLIFVHFHLAHFSRFVGSLHDLWE